MEGKVRHVVDPKEVVHGIVQGAATTACCNKTPFELPMCDRLTIIGHGGVVTCVGRWKK